MSEKITGIIEKWSDPKRTKTGSVRIACQIDQIWFGWFLDNFADAESLVKTFPAGVTVNLEYSRKGDFFNTEYIERAEKQLEQTTVKDAITNKPLLKDDVNKIIMEKLDLAIDKIDLIFEMMQSKADAVITTESA